MGNETLPTQFIFNERMDKDALFGLYTDDLPYIEEMFATTLQHFDPDFDAIKAAYASGHADDLRRAVHKLKPVFGYAGLPDVQQQCKDFEESCGNIADVSLLSGQYSLLINSLESARDLIQSEYLRLKDFNAQML